MKVTISGSGTFVPELKRNSSSYLVETDEGKIVLDLGRGAIGNLLKLKVNLLDLDTIFISHMHADHGSELPNFLELVLSFPDKKKLKEKYTIYGPKGFGEDIDNLLKAFHLDKRADLGRIKIEELDPGQLVEIDGLEISGFKAQHGEGRFDCFGYVVKSKNKKVCYSGDSGACKELEKACENSDLAIIEATGFWNKEHMNGEEVGEIASRAGVKNLVVTHVASTYLSKVEEDVRKAYQGKFAIAEDLMEIKV